MAPRNDLLLRPCDCCGQAFKPYRNNQRFCCHKCRNAYHHEAFRTYVNELEATVEATKKLLGRRA